ncbi:hypothetical protein SprV_0602212500 [Sparganum proliferum]
MTRTFSRLIFCSSGRRLSSSQSVCFSPLTYYHLANTSLPGVTISSSPVGGSASAIQSSPFSVRSLATGEMVAVAFQALSSAPLPSQRISSPAPI